MAVSLTLHENFDMNEQFDTDQFYAKLKEDREKYLEEMKCLQESVISHRFMLKMLQLSVTTIELNSKTLDVILSKDMEQIDLENSLNMESN